MPSPALPFCTCSVADLPAADRIARYADKSTRYFASIGVVESARAMAARRE
jgi:hypothetical protein